MKKLGLLFGLNLLLCAPLMAQSTAQGAAGIEFTADGTSMWYALPPQGLTSGTEVSVGDTTFTLNQVSFDSDPFVLYSYNVTNNSTTPTPYTVTFYTPATLSSGSYQVSSTLGYTLSAPPGGSISLLPPSPNAVAQAYFGGTIVSGNLVGGTDAGVDLGTATVTLDNTSSEVPASSSQNYSLGPQAYLLGTGVGQIAVTDTFELEGEGSVGITGVFNVQATPEPSSVGLGLIALGAFGGLMLRARRTRA